VDVFRHSDVAYQREAIAIAHLVQIRDENIPGANRAQQRQASLTTECDEMEMPAPGVPKQFVGRRMEEKSEPQPFQSKGWGTLKSQTDGSALTYWTGIIQLCAYVNRIITKGLATRQNYPGVIPECNDRYVKCNPAMQAALKNSCRIV